MKTSILIAPNGDCFVKDYFPSDGAVYTHGAYSLPVARYIAGRGAREERVQEYSDSLQRARSNEGDEQ